MISHLLLAVSYPPPDGLLMPPNDDDDDDEVDDDEDNDGVNSNSLSWSTGALHLGHAARSIKNVMDG